MAQAKRTAPLAGTSDQALSKATGKNWAAWIDLLDGQDAQHLPHKEIVKILSGYLHHPWWCQKIAIGYSQYKGNRILGQAANQKFQVGVSRTLNVDKDTLWNLLASEEGMEIWLGKAEPIVTDNPQAYRTEEGIEGEFTVLKPGSHFRMTWQPGEWESRSILQVRAIGKGDRSVLSFHQEELPSAAERDRMKTHWTSKVNQLLNLLNNPSDH